MSILHFASKPKSALSGQQTDHTEASRQRRTHPSVAAFQTRKDKLLGEIHEFLQRQDMLATEIERQIANCLQLIASLFVLQDRIDTAETAERLTIAAGHVVTLERLSHQLHSIGQRKAEEMKRHLQLRYEELHDLANEPQINSAPVRVISALERVTTCYATSEFSLDEFADNSVTYVDLTELFDQQGDCFSVATN